MDTQVLVGTRILGYRVEECIGKGGMGAVFRGTHPLVEQTVAIKVLDPLLARNPDLRERFLREARIQITLNHPHIVRVLTVDTESENLSIIMELVQGISLDKLLETRGKLPREEALLIFIQVLEALQYR